MKAASLIVQLVLINMFLKKKNIPAHIQGPCIQKVGRPPSQINVLQKERKELSTSFINNTEANKQLTPPGLGVLIRLAGS